MQDLNQLPSIELWDENIILANAYEYPAAAIEKSGNPVGSVDHPSPGQTATMW